MLDSHSSKSDSGLSAFKSTRHGNEKPSGAGWNDRLDKEVDTFISKVPAGQNWANRWKELEVGGQADKDKLITDVLVNSPMDQADSPPASNIQRLISSLHQYRDLRESRKPISLRTQHVVSFQELLLVSLCVALEELNVLDSVEVLVILRDGISNSTTRTLNRLKLGVRWLNQLVDALYWRGWGMRAIEIFFLGQHPPLAASPSN